ncbi:MAG: TlpA family protein disulfide reductase [Verrucomicrobia bacterium]|nr:TlpA family protein disulfide reductase [Verrucomicrobiota bacterium]
MRTLVSIIALFLVVAFVATAQPAHSRLAIGAKVPDFAVTTLDGQKRSLAELQKDAAGKARPVVLTFWCTFCGSCREVDARLAEFARTYGNKVAFHVLDASANEPASKVTAFLKQKNLAMPVLLDSTGRSADVFGVKLTTTTVVIDANGVLRYRGRFGRAGESPAEDAVKSVLDGGEVKIKEPGYYG